LNPGTQTKLIYYDPFRSPPQVASSAIVCQARCSCTPPLRRPPNACCMVGR